MTDQKVITIEGKGGHRDGVRPNPLITGNLMNALKPRFVNAALCTGLLLVFAPQSWAEDTTLPASAEPESVVSVFGNNTALSASELNSERAKQKIEVDRIQINDQDLNGTVSDNTAIGNNTGHNTISGDAFSGAAGFISSVQNSGNNVLIQNATIINVAVEP